MTLNELRCFSLQRQGLSISTEFGIGKEAVLKAIEQLGYIQIDTLSVVERAHHHSLWSRISDYQPHYLDELLDERCVFEYWFHAASYLPIRDFRFALPQMEQVRNDDNHYYKADPRMMRYVLDAIKSEGPKKARDFEQDKTKHGSWWNWKPAKIALERLFLQGDIMVSSRHSMQKSYDLTGRVLPQNLDLRFPTDFEVATYLVETYLRAYGVTNLKQILHLKKSNLLKHMVVSILEEKKEAGEVRDFVDESGVYWWVDLSKSREVLKRCSPRIHILSPFDNAVIHRERLKGLFDFDFKLECYVPKVKREYGYFCLPILWGDTFLGRIDCKAHRKDKILEVIHLFIERNMQGVTEYLDDLVQAIVEFSNFNSCHSVQIVNVSPSWMRDLVQAKFMDE